MRLKMLNKNKFFITEVPISFAHEADRYFVFADMLFDFSKNSITEKTFQLLISLSKECKLTEAIEAEEFAE